VDCLQNAASARNQNGSMSLLLIYAIRVEMSASSSEEQHEDMLAQMLLGHHRGMEDFDRPVFRGTLSRAHGPLRKLPKHSRRRLAEKGKLVVAASLSERQADTISLTKLIA
jgi:hypothetical protein